MEPVVYACTILVLARYNYFGSSNYYRFGILRVTRLFWFCSFVHVQLGRRQRASTSKRV